MKLKKINNIRQLIVWSYRVFLFFFRELRAPPAKHVVDVRYPLWVSHFSLFFVLYTRPPESPLLLCRSVRKTPPFTLVVGRSWFGPWPGGQA